MNIPPKYEYVVAQLEAALGRESEMVSRANQGKLEMDADSGTIDLLEKDLSTWKQKACEAAEREAALREELDALRESYEAMRDRKSSIVDLQQRLTVAEQRADELEGLLFGDILEAMDDFGDRHDLKRCREIAKDIRALKPAEGEGS